MQWSWRGGIRRTGQTNLEVPAPREPFVAIVEPAKIRLSFLVDNLMDAKVSPLSESLPHISHWYGLSPVWRRV
jgi:hypothetical protein